MKQIHFEAIGTRWQIDSLDKPIEQQVVDAIKHRVEIFEDTYSRFRNGSFVANLASDAGTYILPEDAKPLFDLYFELYKITNKKFTPLIGQTLEELGYDKTYSFKANIPTKLDDLSQVASYQYPKLTIAKPVRLDFGAAGKGYIIDIVSDLLKESGYTEFIVDAGGDIVHYSKSGKAVPVGLENPINIAEAVGVATIDNRSICGSSGNRRKWSVYTHIIDPETLASPKNILATWVVAKNTMLADALSTCLFLADPAKLQEHYDFEYLIIYEGQKVSVSDNFPAELFYV